MIDLLIAFLALTATHFALRCREQARVIRRQSKTIAARDEKLVLLHRNIVLIAGRWALEKQESARLRQESTVRAPSDAELERGYWQ